jgi:hypothetical protein
VEFNVFIWNICSKLSYAWLGVINYVLSDFLTFEQYHE